MAPKVRTKHPKQATMALNRAFSVIDALLAWGAGCVLSAHIKRWYLAALIIVVFALVLEYWALTPQTMPHYRA